MGHHRSGYHFKHFKWTEEHFEEMRRRYPVEGAPKLAKDFGVSSSTIENKAKVLGLVSPRSRKVQLNKENLKEDYFDVWSPVMAYDLGYIWADGWIIEDGSPKVGLHCERQDEQMILDIRERLGSHHEVVRKQKIMEETGTICYYTKVEITNKALMESLQRHGMTQAKSRCNLGFPSVEPFCLRDFARGNLDGDGCVSSSNLDDPATRSRKLYWKGSHAFIQGMKVAVMTAAHIKAPYEYQPKAGNQTVTMIQWSDRDSLLRLRDWLYPEGLNTYPHLSRKREALELALTW